MKKLLLLAIAGLSLTAVAQNAQLAPGEYYLRHKDTGYYINSGFTWGTLGVIKAQPRAFNLAPNTDGTYTAESSLGFFKDDGGETYLDGGDNIPLAITANGDGTYNLAINGKSIVKNEERFFENSWDLGNKHANPEHCWTLALNSGATDSWEIVSRAQMIVALDNATPENPVVATFYIKGRNVDVRDKDIAQVWKYTVDGNPENLIIPDPSWGTGIDDWHNRADYIWVHNGDKEQGASVYTLSQQAEGLKAGDYIATYRIANQATSPLSFKLNDTECEVYNAEGTDMWYGSAVDHLRNSERSAKFTVGADGKLNIDITKNGVEGQQDRFAFKTLNLAYIGEGAGIDNVAADNTDAPVEYYNLQGVRVANPGHGLYIKRQGTTATKVVL